MLVLQLMGKAPSGKTCSLGRVGS